MGLFLLAHNACHLAENSYITLKYQVVTHEKALKAPLKITANNNDWGELGYSALWSVLKSKYYVAVKS